MKKKGNKNVKIIGIYKNSETEIECQCNNDPNHKWKASPKTLLRGKGCPICGKKMGGIKNRKTNEEFLKEMKEKGNNNVIVIGEYITAKTPIECHCKNNDKHIWYSAPTDLLQGKGCPYCAGIKILENDQHCVGNEYPDLIKFFVDKEIPFKFSPHSLKKVKLICPICGKEKTNEITISDLVNRGFSCEFCGNKNSLPNRIIRNIAYCLKEKNMILDFYLEYIPEWGKSYRYDCCLILLNKAKILIEMQGGQHYNKKSKWYRGEDDKNKRKLAKENKTLLIEINCQKTDFDSIFNEIEKSELKELISSSKIDKEFIRKQCSNNFMRQICDYYESEKFTTIKEMALYFKVHISTITFYLKEGFKLGWTNYPNKNNNKRIKIGIFDAKTNKILKIYISINDCFSSIEKDFGLKIAKTTLRRRIENETIINNKYYFKKMTN